MSDPLPLAIIGSGYAAVCLLAHMFDQAPEKARQATLYGPTRLGYGAAFAASHPSYRLNVRPPIMQLWPDRLDDFGLWAQTHIKDPQAHTPEGAFYRRGDFAKYLNDQIDKVTGFTHVKTQIAAITRDRTTKLWMLKTANGQLIEARTIILATGNPPPKWPCPVHGALEADARLVENPWRGEWLNEVDSQQNVTLIGGGLTAMDAVYGLGQNLHKGRIRLITPLPSLPPKQTDWPVIDPVIWPENITNAADLFGFMKDYLGSYEWTDPHWQSRFEALRIHINKVWRRLEDKEKRRLFRHAGQWWNLARYRSSPQSFDMAQRLIDSGQLEIITGRVMHVEARINRPVRLSLFTGEHYRTDWLINCTGPGRDRLCDQLSASNLASHDAFGRFVRIDEDFRLVLQNGNQQASGFGLGAMTAGSAGDVVGAGAIARQAARLASILINS